MTAKEPDTNKGTVQVAESSSFGERSQLIAPSIVGIGASAGGLDALKRFLDALSPGDQLGFVVAQHLSPKHVSLLGKLLQHGTALEVLEAKDGVVPRPGLALVTPPKVDVELRDGKIVLLPPGDTPHPKPSVDRLFKSLAAELGDRAIGIVLSGTGTDGAEGCKAIKAAGGTVLVQSPDSAAYDGMPRSAIATGCSDIITTPIELAKVVRHLADHPGEIRNSIEGFKPSRTPLEEVASIVREKTAFDLLAYKEPTLLRRIDRRLALHRLGSLEDYATLLSEESDEAAQLVRDVSIPVTSFMRDRDAFSALKPQLRSILDRLDDNEPFRAWVVGCASGEEAYTLAMMISEAMETLDTPRTQFTLFATDIDEASLDKAKRGVYSSEQITPLPAAWKTKYLEAETDSTWAVNRDLRRKVVFANHNLLTAPPYSRIHLVTCRNLLIYLRPEMQSHAMEIFHFSLVQNGTLFLGKTENVHDAENLFEAVDAGNRIYTRLSTISGLRVQSNGMKISLPVPRSETRTSRQTDSDRQLRLAHDLMRKICPPTMIINDRDEVTYSAGPLRDYIDFPVGMPSLHLYDLLPKKQRSEIRAHIIRVRRSGETSSTRLDTEDRNVNVFLHFEPYELDGVDQVMVRFEAASSKSNESGQPAITPTFDPESTTALAFEELERELGATRQHAQSVAEELETANEELQATNEELQSTNEELQSTNEELQSTNEELQTSNEELQSSNEELRTLNDQMAIQSERLEGLATGMQSLKSGLPTPFLLVNRQLKVLHINQATLGVLKDEKLRTDCPITDLNWHFDIGNLIDASRNMLNDGNARSCIIEHNDITWLVQVTPTHLPNDERSGAAIFFSDISAQITAEKDALSKASLLAKQVDRLNVTLECIGDGVITTDNTGRVQSINPAGSRICGWDHEQANGEPIESVYRILAEDPIGNEKSEPVHPVMRCLTSGAAIVTRDSDTVILGRSGRRVMVTESIAPLNDGKENFGAVVVFRDESDERLLNRELLFRATHDTLTHLANRYEFDRQIRHACEVSQSHNIKIALMMIDLDNFKQINDNYGHHVGDRVLTDISAIIQSNVRTSDVPSRLGGDEFAVLLRNCDADQARKLGEKLNASIAEHSIGHEDEQVQVTASIGICVMDESIQSASELMQIADAAAYKAKESGKNSVYFAYADDPVIRTMRSKTQVAASFQSALEQNQFEVSCQNAVRSNDQSKRPVYRELLVKMREADGRLRPPEKFTQAAEQHHLMDQIDLWVFERLLEYLIENPKSRNETLWAMNLNASTVRGGKAHDQIISLLEKNPEIAPSICFEISETSAIVQLSSVAPFVNRVKDLGALVALDDFGTGASGFSYIRGLRVDFIKIDGSVVASVISDPIDRKMVQSTCEIASELNIQTIAEHVRDEETHNLVRELGVDLVQGALFGEPEIIHEAKK